MTFLTVAFAKAFLAVLIHLPDNIFPDKVRDFSEETDAADFSSSLSKDIVLSGKCISPDSVFPGRSVNLYVYMLTMSMFVVTFPEYQLQMIHA